MSRKSGYFICYRNIWQHPVFKNLLQASCWIYMISSASHQDKELRFLDNVSKFKWQCECFFGGC